MQITKKQHYVPRGILKHFLDEEGKVYEVYIEKDIVSKKEVKNVMMQNYVYEHPDLPMNMLENSFSQAESRVIPTIDKIIGEIESCYRREEYSIKFHAILQDIIPYLLLFYFRSGALLHEYEFSTDTPKVSRVEKMLDNILDGNYIISLCNTLIDCYEWALLVDEDRNFLISDQYISTAALKYKNKFTNASNRQIGMKETMLLLPLSSKFYFAFYSGNVPGFIKKDRINILTNNEVQVINNVIYQNSYIKCVGNKESELVRVNKIKNHSKQSPTGCIIKQENGCAEEYVLKKEVFVYDEDRDLEENHIRYVSDYILKIKGQVSRNSKCICGSNKKYKNCCMTKYEKVKYIAHAIEHPNQNNYCIPGAYVEHPIHIYSGEIVCMPNNKSKDIIRQIEEKRNKEIAR